MSLKPILIVLFSAFPFFLWAQNEDCINAIVICSDGPIDQTPTGPGENDFSNGNNDEDCLLGLEHQSGWYYFEFRTDMPPNSVIEFTVNPYAGALEDYDFAVYGPDVTCDNLGSPIRCSFADDGCLFCPQTGLGNGTTDTSEPASGDGYVAPLVVQPGQGFYLLMDNFNNSSQGFNMTWGGSAAPYLNCLDCELELFPGGPVEVCGGTDPFMLPVSISGNMGAEVYSWTATGGGLSYLSSTNVLNPTVTIPNDFSGSITYTLSVSEETCEVMTEVVVIVSPLPEVMITGPESICSTEEAILSATPGYQMYSWSNGGNTSNITVTDPGTYSVTVTDGNGCQNEDSFTLEVTPAPELSASPPPLLCAGSDPFNMGVSVTGVTGGESYIWSGTAEALGFLSSTSTLNPTVTLPDDFSGFLNYTLTVMEGNCQDMIDIMLAVAPLPGIFISGPEAVCEGQEANLSATSGYPDYQWSNGGSGENISVTLPGTYTVTVTDSNGCQNEESFEVIVNPLPDPEINGDAYVCQGQPSELIVTPAFTSYLWSNGSVEQTATYTEPGVAMLIVTDDNGCEGYTEFAIDDLNIPAPVILGDPEICHDESTILSTSASYVEYFWSDGSTTPQIEVTTGDNFFLTVTDANGCEADTAFFVFQAPELFPVITGDSAICAGDETTLFLIDSYEDYSWSTSETEPSITTTPGTFSVTVTDEYYCEYYAEFTVGENPLPEPEISGLASFCLDASTTISVSEDFEEYIWSNGDSTQSVVINQEGNYSVTVVDENNCVGDTSVFVSELEELEPLILGDPQFCAGDSTVLISEDGYSTYVWSDGTEMQSITLNTPGSVTLSVTDINGCTGATTIDVFENALPQPQIQTEGYFCEGDSVVLETNDAYMQYLWSNADTTSQTFASVAGDYIVTVTDINGCQASAMTTIEEITLPNPAIQGPEQFCPGTNADLEGEEGFSAYQWDNGQTSQIITISQPGTYTLTVTDSYGCVGSNNFSISEFITNDPAITGELQFCPDTETSLTGESGFVSYDWSNGLPGQTAVFTETGPAVLTVTDSNGCITSNMVNLDLFEVTPPMILGEDNFCTGQSTVLTGEPGYISYEWSDGTMDAQLTVSSGGNYSVTALDSNLCYSNTSINIIENALPEPQILGPLTFCIGNFTTLEADQTYQTYQWSTGDTNSSIQANVEGAYSLIVANEFGCIDSTSVFITQETELEPEISGPLEYCENGNTIITAGPGYATYDWSTGESSQSITVDQPGTYLVTVTDFGGCIGDGEVVVIENPLPAPQIEGILQYCAQDSTELDAGPGYQSYLWTGGNLTQQQIVTQPGNYAVTVTDFNGCSNTDIVTVTELPLPQVSINGQFYFCDGDTTVLNATAGYISYDWSIDGVGSQVSVFSEDSYSVTVTDENGCQSATVEFVEEITNPVADAGPDLFLDCDTHTAILMAENSTQGSGFSYQWFGPGINASNETELTPEISVPGTYQLLVTDEIHGCMSYLATTTLTDLAYEPVAILTEPEILNCETETVLIDGSNSDNGSHIIYQWFDGQNNQISGAVENVLPVSLADMYSILVLDTLTACSSMASTNVNEDYNYPIAEAGPNQHLDCIVETVDLNGENSSQGNSFSYTWNSNDGNILSGGGSLVATGNEPGHYFLTVLNSDNGCASMDSVLVTQDITPPIANAGMDMEINCHQSSVELNGLASSIGNQYTLNWTMDNNPAIISTTPLFTVETPGTYQLMVSNLINGCESIDEVIVNEGPMAPTGIDFETDTPTCFGDADGALIIQEVLGGEGPYLYSLDEDNFQQSSIFSQLTGGVYEVLVQDVNGCEFEIDVQVPDGNDLWLDLGDDQTIELGDEADLYALFNIPETSISDFTWNPDPEILCDSCFIQNLSPTSTNTYGATLIDENGCSTSDLVTIYVQKNRNVYIPNVFSPNLDGNNDVFMIFSGKGVKEVISFQIYNRWGEQVFQVYNFQPNNPDYGWNGKFRGTPCNSAVFVWYAEIAFEDGEIVLFKGDVTLIR